MGIKKKVLDKGLAISPGFIRVEPPTVIRPEIPQRKAAEAYRAQSKLFTAAKPKAAPSLLDGAGSEEEQVSLEEILDSKPKAA